MSCIADKIVFEELSISVNCSAKVLMDFMLDSDVIQFLVGAQMNKAHYDPNLPIEIEIRKNVIKKIALVLEEKYLKKVNVQFI